GAGTNDFSDFGDGTDIVTADTVFSLAGIPTAENLASEFAAGPVTFTGNDNDNIISGSQFVDDLTGGIGNDTYNVTTGDVIHESAGRGTDEARSTQSFVLPANVENLTLLDGDRDVQTFDDMDTGPIVNGENGWRVNGPNAPRDQEIVDVNGNHMFRMSSDPAVADFAGPVSPELRRKAGEPGTGAAHPGQSVRFDFPAGTSIPDASRLELDFGNAAGTDRNNFMAIESFGSTGIRIIVSEPAPDGSFSGDSTSPAPNDWRELVSHVDPATSHHLEM